VAPRWRQSGTEHVLAALAAHHTSQTLSDGLPREELRERVLAGLAPGLVDLILADLERTGRIVGRERVALPDGKWFSRRKKRESAMRWIACCGMRPSCRRTRIAWPR
jgi:hypothetical protein